MTAAQASDPPNGWIVVNALGGLGDPNHPSDSLVPNLSPRVLAEAHASGLHDGQRHLGLCVGAGRPLRGERARHRRNRPADPGPRRRRTKILTVADVRRAKGGWEIGLLYGFQNGTMMGEDAGRVDIFADLGGPGSSSSPTTPPTSLATDRWRRTIVGSPRSGAR